MSANIVSILSAVSIIFIGALAGGRLAALVHIPRVTGYLVTGLLTGPSLAPLLGFPSLLTTHALKELQIVSDVALALILMNIGGLFQFSHLRRWRHHIALFSFCEIGLTFLLVCGAVLVTNLAFLQKTVADLSLWQTSLRFSLFLGIIAVATAPAATLMVVREYEADGPVTGTVLTLVGLNNIVAVLAYAIAAHLLIQPEEGITILLFRMAGPILVGAFIGFVMSVWAQRLELPSEQKLLLLGGVAASTALCRYLHIDHLLASLVLGIALSNSSPHWHQLTQALRQFDYILYVAFFVLAGANLHIETLGHIGVLGIAYVLARTLGKYLGAFLGARLGAFGRREKYCVGLTLLAQAGVAIGLAASLSRHWSGGGKLLETVVLGSVVVFELVGPLAVRYGLVRAGEVPILSLLQKRAPQGAWEGLHSVAQHFRSSLGIPAGHKLKDPGDILVRHVMRQNVETIRADTPYNELLRLIAHSRYDRFPVVDLDGRFLGMINYTDIRNLLFEPSLAPLVVAGDLAAGDTRHALAPDMPLREVLKILKLNRDISYFPVIAPEEPDRLMGILNQNDILSTFRRLNGD